VIGAVGAIVAAVITGVLGLYAGAIKGAPGVSAGVSTVTVTATGAGAGGSGSAANGAQGIYHKGTLALAFGTCVDLDAPPGDAQWGETSDANTGGADFCSESPGFPGLNGATIVPVSSGTDTTCQNATGWFRQNAYQNLNLNLGSFVCVHTNVGRYSLLRVDHIDSTNSSITFAVKTFKKSGD